MKLFWQASSDALSLKQIHPCVINSRPSLVHHAELEALAPHLFRSLQDYASKLGMTLCKDRRKPQGSSSESRPARNRRKSWLLIASLTAAQVIPSASDANNSPDGPGEYEKTQLASTTSVHNTSVNREEEHVESATFWQKKMTATLIKHWQPSADDPDNTVKFLDDIGRYYSGFIDIRALLVELDPLPWKIGYSEKNYQTEVYGDKTNIDYTMVYFDPLLAAQLQFGEECTSTVSSCIAAPADLLLHELLHVKIILTHPQLFIRNAYLANSDYPHDHEATTIQLEQQYFRAMTEIDQRPRPKRKNHTGKRITVACSTCTI